MSGIDVEHAIGWAGGAMVVGGASSAEVSAVNRAVSDEASQRRAANKDAGVIPLQNIAGANTITARLPSQSWASGVTIGTLTRVELVAAATNDGPVTLQVDGDAQREVLRQNGTPMQAGDLKYGRSYILRWRGDKWRLVGGDVATSDLGSAAYRPAGDFAGAQRVADLEDEVSGIVTGTRVVGDWDASTGAFPTQRPDGTTIQAGDTWNVSAAGTVDGQAFDRGYVVTALKDGGGLTYAGNWSMRVAAATNASAVQTTQGGTVQQRLDDIPIDALDAGRPPEVTDDSTQGFAQGSRWLMGAAEWVNVSAVPSAAVWRPLDLTTVDPEHFGRMGQGEDGALIQEAMNWASARGINGAEVNLRNRVWTTERTINPRDNIKLSLDGGVLTRAAGTMHTMIMSELFIERTGTEADDGDLNFKVHGGEIDGAYVVGNAAECGQWEGAGILYFGRLLEVQNVKIRNLRGIGFWPEYGGAQSPHGHKFLNILIENIGRTGYVHNVSDAHLHSLNVRSVARSGEADCDGIQLRRFLRGSAINVWQPGSGLNTDNMRYAFAALGNGAEIFGGTFEHGRDACLYVDPACIYARFSGINTHTDRGAPSPIALIRSNDGKYDLTCRAGTINRFVPLVQIGADGDAVSGNMIGVTCRREQASLPEAAVNFVGSGGNNIVTIGGDLSSTAGTPNKPWKGSPKVSDRIISAVANAPWMDPNEVPRSAQTVDATPAVINLTMPNAALWIVTGTIVGRQVGGSGRFVAEIKASVGRGTGGTTTALLGAPVISVNAQNAATGWSVAVAADMTAGTGGLNLSLTGAAGATINWQADLRVNEVR